MPITDILEKNAKLYGNDVALVELNPQELEKRHVTWREYSLIEPSRNDSFRTELTWEEFDRKANRMANLLLTRHIHRGSKVAILLMNCLEWLPIYFGILKCGATAVPLNFRYTADEIRYCLDLADVDVLVFGLEFVGRIEDICDRIPRVKTLLYVGEECPSFAEPYYNLASYCSSKSPAIPLTDDDDAAIYFSSGTTGFPKAILHTHRSLMHACRVEQNHHRQTREDTFLCIPPLYHTGAKMHWFGSLLVGGRAVLLRGTRPEWILSAVSEEHCTVVWLLVPWAQDILDAIERGDIKLEEFHLDQWRLMHIGAQPVPPSLIKRWKAIFPHHDYDTNYGLSESIGPGAVHLGIENIDHVGAIGVAGYGWQTKIVDENHRPVPRGTVGELAVKGDGVMKCYYKDEKATREVLEPDGWLHTGDLGIIDEEGNVFIKGRSKNMLLGPSGQNIYPEEIEEILNNLPFVNESIVIQKDNKLIGLVYPDFEEAAAQGLTEDDITRVMEENRVALNTQIPSYAQVSRIKIFHEEFEKTPKRSIKRFLYQNAAD